MARLGSLGELHLQLPFFADWFRVIVQTEQPLQLQFHLVRAGLFVQ
jgi:hypothetical protein